MDKHAKLYTYLERRVSEPFRWGSMDCCLMAADWIVEATGKDPYASFRGKYTSALGAARLFKPFGGLLQATARTMHEYEFQEFPPLMAQRGDLVVVEHDGRQFVAISIGARVVVPGPTGITYLTGATVLKAWRI